MKNTLVKNNNLGTLDEDAFARQYSRLVTRLVRRYYLTGGDYEDLFQEGMMGLLSAIRKYDQSRSENFEAFASRCIKNRLIDVLRKDISENDKLYGGYRAELPSDITFGDDPEVKVLADESAEEIKMAISNLLSAFEASVMDLYLEGFSVKEISLKINRPAKSVENAIVRIKTKLRDFINKRRQQD